jgi:hypothetical protein
MGNRGAAGAAEAWKRLAWESGDTLASVIAVVAAHYERATLGLGPDDRPTFSRYAECYDVDTLRASKPHGWAAFRAEFPYVGGGSLQVGRSHWGDGPWRDEPIAALAFMAKALR